MKVRLLISATALVASLSCSASAVDSNGLFASRGIGAISCRDLLKSNQTEARAAAPALEGWGLGYISGMNRISPGTYDVLPIQQADVLSDWIWAVCREHPSDTIEAVAFSILRRLETAKLTTESPLVVAKFRDHETAVRRDTLAAVQTALHKKGLFSGRTDGDFSPATAHAIEVFQRSSFLPPTGLPDASTVIRLLLDARGTPEQVAKSKAWWQFW